MERAYCDYSTEEWVNKTWYHLIMEFYSIIKLEMN